VADDLVPATQAPEDDESARLRARVEVLEAELRMRNRELSDLRRERRERRERPREERRERRDMGETAREIVERADEEGRRFVRAMVLTQLEQLRMTADLVGSFAEEVVRRNPADDPDADRDLPRDLYESMLDTVDRALEIPEKTVDTFRDTYKRAKGANEND